MERIYYLIYETKNLVTGKVYRGLHKTKNVNDNYLGSGIAFRSALKKYGAENFEKTILCCALSFEDMCWLEKNVFVNSDWVKREDTYNLIVGGVGGDKESFECLKEASLIKYGVDHPMKCEYVKQKMFNTNMERYGKRSTASVTWVREKAKKTCRKRYGVDYVTQTEQYKEKVKNTWQEKYGEGVINPFQAEEVKTKIKSTLLEKYGVEHISQSEFFKKTSEKTCMEKYGKPRYQNTEEFKAIVREYASVYNITLISPDGTEYKTKNLQGFCKENNLCYSAINNQFNKHKSDKVLIPKTIKLSSEKRENTTGWTIIRELRCE